MRLATVNENLDMETRMKLNRSKRNEEGVNN